MRTSRRWLPFVLLPVLAGCGDRRLLLGVDVLSYLDPSLTQSSFGPVPATPGGLASGEQAVVDNASVNLVEGLGSAVDVQSVSLALGAMVVDSTGAGAETLRVYIGDDTADPRTTVPVLVQALALQPGVTDTVQVQSDAGSRVAALFSGRSLRLSITLSVRGPSSGPPLNGRFQITGLDALVIAGRKGT